MEGQAAVPTAFDGTPVSLYPQMPVGTDQATLVVRNAQGTEVSRQALPISDDVVLWGGFDSTDAPLSAGVYSFELEARSGDKVISVSPIETYGLIKEARVENGQTMLVFESGASVPASEINAVRAPDPGT